jgi:hypothetical protein
VTPPKRENTFADFSLEVIMKIRSTEFLNKRRLLLALCVAVLCLSAPIIGPQDSSALAQDPAVAAVVETIDLTSWQARDGRTLAQVMKSQSLAMMVLVDPNCGDCTKAQSSLRDLRDRVEGSKIKYVILMIPTETDVTKYFAYADSLKLDAEAFVWSNSEAKPPAAVTTMSAPSHLLVSSEGGIANKWAGIPAKF